jgi:hypothetical protein
MFSSKYLLAFVLVVTGLSVFSIPTGANALVLPSHAHARRAAVLLATPGRRATRALKRRLPADADKHMFARRRAPSPVTPDNGDDESQDTPPPGKVPASVDDASAPAKGMVDAAIGTAADATRFVGHTAGEVVKTGGRLTEEAAEEAGTMIGGVYDGVTRLAGKGLRGVTGRIPSHSTVRDSTAPILSVGVQQLMATMSHRRARRVRQARRVHRQRAGRLLLHPRRKTMMVPWRQDPRTSWRALVLIKALWPHLLPRHRCRRRRAISALILRAHPCIK